MASNEISLILKDAGVLLFLFRSFLLLFPPPRTRQGSGGRVVKIGLKLAVEAAHSKEKWRVPLGRGRADAV